nr:protein kinase [Rhodoferax sp.]
MPTPDPGPQPPPKRKGSSPADVAALLPGQTVFEYQIEKVLGGGGFGITYLAHDVNLQLPVAIKEYFPADLAVRGADDSVRMRSADGAAQFEWGLERFIDEARALASFRHPNIVRVLRYFKEHGTAYIVMEYESGDPLKHWLAAHPGLGQHSLLQIVFPLLDGLEAVHKLNFLHRDIKPDNIYMRADGTPVLLDFGAARRVTSGQEMTNIVSPGFAPFEQYHSKGNQGPWTDLYSLGAVMYWMATGRKPMEAASRVRTDDMPKAYGNASTVVFGDALLRAIDWAMTPDETQRPQNVAAFRKVLQEAQRIGAQTMEGGTTHRLAESDAVLAFVAHSQSVPISNAEAMRKNVLGTIMFMDLVSYSTYSMDQQVLIKAMFNELIGKAIAGVKESSRIMLDTGDGAAICFLGDPEEALQSALLMRDLLVHKYGKKLSIRVGLHLGPIRMMMDINNRVNVVGDGINVAQRVMDFSKPNVIVVSRAYYDVISQISDNAANLFNYLGPHTDKHQRIHEIYAVIDRTGQAVQVSASADIAFEPTRTVTPAELITPDAALEIETALARIIGPLAHVLVKKALPRATDAQSLRDALAVSIPDALARDAFLRAHSLSRPLSTPVSSASGFSRTGVSRPSEVLRSEHRSEVRSELRSEVRSDARSDSMKVLAVNAEQQAALEKALGQYLGPLAKTLVRREVARQLTFNTLLQALADHIDKPDEKAKFIANAKKLVGGV